MQVNGLPVEQTSEGRLVAKRSRWSVSEDSEKPWPGQTIECGPVLAKYDPRYLEHLSMFTDEHEIEEGDPVVLSILDPDDSIQPCAFCSPEDAVVERGVIDSDFEMRKPNGELLGYTCRACILDAPLIE